MKKYLFPILAVLLVLLAGCGMGRSTGNQIADALGLDLSGGTLVEDTDTHGGFLGDGTAYAVLQFPDSGLLEQIEGREDWNPLPLSDDDLTALIYGIETASSSIGPYLADEEGSPLFPAAEEGYYFFLDRHSESTDPHDPSGVLDRGSFNFTFALYDTEHNTLCYGELDT